jgi:hypothetical protein
MTTDTRKLAERDVPIPAGKTVVEVLNRPMQSSLVPGDICYIEGMGHGAECGAYLLLVRISDGYIDYANFHDIRALSAGGE